MTTLIKRRKNETLEAFMERVYANAVYCERHAYFIVQADGIPLTECLQCVGYRKHEKKIAAVRAAAERDVALERAQSEQRAAEAREQEQRRITYGVSPVDLF